MTDVQRQHLLYSGGEGYTGPTVCATDTTCIQESAFLEQLPLIVLLNSLSFALYSCSCLDRPYDNVLRFYPTIGKSSR